MVPEDEKGEKLRSVGISHERSAMGAGRYGGGHIWGLKRVKEMVP